MTKGQTVDKLKEMGYDACIEDFEVVISVDHMLTKKEQKKFDKDIRGLGYQASYGWKLRQEDNPSEKKL